MKKCIKCGHELADEAVFCHICGEKQIQSENNSGNTLHVDNQTPQAVKVEKKENDGCLGNAMKLITACLCLLILFGIVSFIYTAYSEQKRSEEIKKWRQIETESSATTVRKRTTLEWSKKSRDWMKWQEAVDYCKNLNENGHSDWRLPTISELRTLIENCPATETGGKCAVTDSCLDSRDCWNAPCKGCYDSSNGIYSRFGDTGSFWSSSTRSDTTVIAWIVYFDAGSVNSRKKYYDYYVRCVR